MRDRLEFFITKSKLTNEVIIREGNFVSISISKELQKPDTNVASPALWVCHFEQDSSTGIELIRFYPGELAIKKHGIIYRGKLKPTGSSEKEEWYHCELIREENEGTSWLTVFLILIIIVALVGIFAGKRGIW